jgi:Ca2+/Na+ antiporter
LKTSFKKELFFELNQFNHTLNLINQRNENNLNSLKLQIFIYFSIFLTIIIFIQLFISSNVGVNSKPNDLLKQIVEYLDIPNSKEEEEEERTGK